MQFCNTCLGLFSQHFQCVRKMSAAAPISISISRLNRLFSFSRHSNSAFWGSLQLRQLSRGHKRILELSASTAGTQISLEKYASAKLGNVNSAHSYSTGGTNKDKEAEQAKYSPLSWKSLVGVAVVGGSILYGMTILKAQREKDCHKDQKITSMGESLLGGDWELTDHHGNKRSSTDFRGSWILIYFGFCNCPDICPEEVEKIVDVISNCDGDANIPKIMPIMITVDPERDTPAVLKEYLAEFTPRMLGFTGSVEEVKQTSRTFRVYYSKGPVDDDGDYIVDHSIISYLVNPKGAFVDYFGRNKTGDVMFKEIKAHIEKYQKEGK